ncbi:MAG: Gfo/Idh/MocA family oxidoreductase [Candidatus Thiodiazotropha sp.]
MRKEKITLGIIGCGMVAEFHLDGLTKMDSVEIKWLCDTSDETLNKLLQKYNVLNGTNKYSNVINDSTVDAIILCTPPSTHFNIAKDVILSGKHILLEKPIAINEDELIELHKLYNNNPDIIVMDASSRHSRLQPKYSYIKNIVDSGIIGEVYHIHHSAVLRKSRPGIEYHPDAKWFLDKNKSGGGPLIDWGGYDLSFHLGLLNDTPELSSIDAAYTNGLDNKFFCSSKFDVEEHGVVFMKFDRRLSYFWERSSNANNESFNTTKIYGTKGGLKFSYLTWESNEIRLYHSEDMNNCAEEIIYIPMNSHTSHIEDNYALDDHFLNCINKKETPILPFDIAVKNISIIFRAYSSGFH